MNRPLNSDLVSMIQNAIEDCYNYGSGQVEDEREEDSITVYTEWVEGKNGYSVINITIAVDGVIKFSYDDYGTECSN